MSVFFKSLLYAAVAGGLCSSIVGKAYEKHVRYLIALLCTALIVSPLLSLIPSFDFSKPEAGGEASADFGVAEALIVRQGAEDAEKAVKEYIFSETGIKPKAVSIQIKSKEEGLVVEKLTVSLHAVTEEKTVKDCLEGLFQDTLTIEVKADA